MEEKKSNVPEWLKNLQENSWEVELLISGGAIFSLFQVSNIYLEFMESLKITSHFAGTGVFIILGMLGIKILTTGFFFHLFLRAIWLGMVCINYVFPKGISEKKKNYARPYSSKFSPNDNLYYEIQRVDRASGLVMFFSILSLLVILGVLLSVIILVTIPVGIFDIALPSGILLLWLAYLFDLLFFGVLRKIPIISYLTYPIFWVLDFFSLRKLYEKPLRLMSSNLKRKYAVVGFSSMLLLSSFFTYSSVYQLMHWPNLLDPRDNRWNLTAEDNWMSYRFYMDELERHEKKASGPVIQSELIKDEFLKVFIPYNKSFDDFDLDDGEYIVSLFRLSIDDVVLDEVSWYSYRAPENDQLGMRTLIDISDLQKGHYRLRVFDTNKRFEEVIPFWKE
jgi:hypothetical protein